MGRMLIMLTVSVVAGKSRMFSSFACSAAALGGSTARELAQAAGWTYSIP